MMSSRISYKTGSRRHDLPEEIIEDIILRLPVKSILRFRSVSKYWFNLTKSRPFINKHLNKNEESLLAMFLVVRVKNYLKRRILALCMCDDPNETLASLFLEGKRLISIRSYQKPSSDYALPVFNFELPELPCNQGSNIDLVGHCNGILCLMTDSDVTGDSNLILLVNPSLKEIKTLPTPPSCEKDPVEMIKLARIELYPEEYCTLAGFGYDSMTMDFKVVRIMNLDCWGPQQRADVYNLKSNAWRKLDEFPFVVDHADKCSTFFNGVLHWCVVIQDYGWRMLTFNMANELFQLMDFPLGWDNGDDGNRPALFVLNQDSLAFVSYFRSSQFVNVWTMKTHEIGETWTKLYSIGPLPQLTRLSFSNNHKFLYKTYPAGKLFSYDLLNKHSSEVCDISRLKDKHRFYQSWKMGECRSSLVSINM